MKLNLFNKLVLLGLVLSFSSLVHAPCLVDAREHSEGDEGARLLYSDLSGAGVFLAGNRSRLSYVLQRLKVGNLEITPRLFILTSDIGGMSFRRSSGCLSAFAFSLPTEEKASSKIVEQHLKSDSMHLDTQLMRKDWLRLLRPIDMVQRRYGDGVVMEIEPVSRSVSYYVRITSSQDCRLWEVTFSETDFDGQSFASVNGRLLDEKGLDSSVRAGTQFAEVRVDEDGDLT